MGLGLGKRWGEIYYFKNVEFQLHVLFRPTASSGRFGPSLTCWIPKRNIQAEAL
ncbi:MAG: hypothetical protein ABJC87_01205 [Roseobacter sp.]